MSDRPLDIRALTRAASLVVALLAAAFVAQGGIARAQSAGALIKMERQLAPYLAAGGSLGDLCEDADLPFPGCAQCDMCCLYAAAAPADVLRLPGLWRTLVSLSPLRQVAHQMPWSQAVTSPPTRAPPIPA